MAYGKILKQDVLDALPMGWYNLHFSLLPQWRGAAPVQRSIWAGEKVTGATVFRIVRAMDAGPILAQSTVEIGVHETAGELLNRLAEDGSRLLAASLQAMADDQIIPVEQPAGAYEIAQKITVEDAHIRFDIPVFAVDRQIRACTPNPGAWCELHANAEAKPTTLHVLRAQSADMGNPNTPTSLEPGQIVAGKKNVWVGHIKLPCEHHDFTRQLLLYQACDTAIQIIRRVEYRKSTKKIKDPRQIAFVHTMWSIRLNRRLGAERHTEPGGMNHRQIIGPITNRNGLIHTYAHM